ncbi:hypothetical protein [Herbidospora mongoliensis]|uniref:hypothetical protein n=1 Tax=Herbidospora mongoliensis TaxID=688067 RepID=UPI0008322AB2|nr:hypothetical protein [Herbidospora mongoliensis]
MTDSRTSAQRRIAADISWARTPDRAERTEAARRASPMRVEYWIEYVRAEGIVPEAGIQQAAEKYHSAHMTRMALKAVAARARKKQAEPQLKAS